MKDSKVKDFMEKIHKIYNKKDLNLSEKTKEELLNQYKKLDQEKTNLVYAAYDLYPLIRDDSYDNKEDEDLMAFLKYLERNKWKAYFGMVLGSAFSK